MHRGSVIAFLLATVIALQAIGESIPLPEPRTEGTISVEEAIASRRSRRNFEAEPPSLWQVGQLLWAAQGITGHIGTKELRAAPSAGALYPLTIYVFAFSVANLEPGIYAYLPETHSLEVYREEISLSAVEFARVNVYEAPVVFVFTGDYDWMRRKYPEHAESHTHIEVGHAGQNLYLQAEVLGLGTVITGHFLRGDQWPESIRLPDNHTPIAIMPLGYTSD